MTCVFPTKRIISPLFLKPCVIGYADSLTSVSILRFGLLIFKYLGRIDRNSSYKRYSKLWYPTKWYMAAITAVVFPQGKRRVGERFRWGGLRTEYTGRRKRCETADQESNW